MIKKTKRKYGFRPFRFIHLVTSNGGRIFTVKNSTSIDAVDIALSERCKFLYNNPGVECGLLYSDKDWPRDKGGKNHR